MVQTQAHSISVSHITELEHSRNTGWTSGIRAARAWRGRSGPGDITILGVVTVAGGRARSRVRDFHQRNRQRLAVDLDRRLRGAGGDFGQPLDGERGLGDRVAVLFNGPPQ